MAKELPYFKFEPNEWENGNIQMCNHTTKGIFMDICSMYWSRLGDLPEQLAIRKLYDRNTSVLRPLYDLGIIEKKEGYIIIKFLDEQLENFEKISEQNRKNIASRWSKGGKNTSVIRSKYDRNTNVIPEEKKREEKKRVKMTPPTIKEVIDYFDEKGYSEKSAKRAFDYYEANNWKDSTGKAVKSWKQKMIAVWFKPENEKTKENRVLNDDGTINAKNIKTRTSDTRLLFGDLKKK